MSLIPLAERVRPKELSEFIGQDHLLGKGKSLRTMIENNTLKSMILWGPPGTGKTTLAKIIAVKSNAEFFEISAVSSGVREIKEITKSATENFNNGRKTILFIDEIHRFNKAQQDALLHSVESGIITLIGATTENPSFEVISALLSRTVIYTLKELSPLNLKQILFNAMKNDPELSQLNIEIEDVDYLLLLSSGDARILLNGFEAAVEIARLKNKENLKISNEILNEAFQKKKITYDKQGESHYNLISAFIKSIRGSDPDAAVYWLARMIAGGEDPLFIARRMIILASEDIGNAMPTALLVAVNAFTAVSYIGMPESRIILSQCATYLASCPKSNAAYLAIDSALADVEKLPEYQVPLHLRNAPTGFMKNLGYGNGYQYPHDFDNHFLQTEYLPPEIIKKIYYYPTELGQEKILKDRLMTLWKGYKKY